MTNEQINIAIAEACGWKSPFQQEWLRGYDKEGGDVWAFSGTDQEGDRAPLPNYCANLNAMHEAEKTLDGLHMQDFVFNLLRVVNAQTPGRTIAQLGCFAHIHATASQRARAFLETLGLWEDEK